jgi:hypothetical protein
MDKAHVVRWRWVLAGVALLCLARGAVAKEDDPRQRIRDAREKIKVAVKACRDAAKEGQDPDFDDLRSAMASLAVDAPGLRALAKYQDHKEAWVALLAVRAIAGAPAKLQLLAGRILASRVDPRYLTDERRLVYIETVRGLGRSGYLGGVKTMMKTLDRPLDSTVSHAIVEAFGRLGDPQVVAKLQNRLTSGVSASLRGPNAGSQAGKRGRSLREGTGLLGGKNNATVVCAKVIWSLAEDIQPVDERKVSIEIYETLAKLLGKRFGGWKEIDRHLREHEKELKKAILAAQKKLRQQEKTIAKLR